MTSPLTGVLLMNVGTPDSPRTTDVRRYLTQFLGDGRVIDLPALARRALVNGIIVPFRAPKSAKAYRKLWTGQGSPLIVHGTALRDGLRNELGDRFRVELAMRYQNPPIEKGLRALLEAGCERILLAPLFPQYASSSTGSAVAEAMRVLGAMNDVPPITTLAPFHRSPGYLNAFAEHIRRCGPERFDHILFSFHGLPERHIERSHVQCSMPLEKVIVKDPVEGCPCERSDFPDFPSCYKMQCHATARALAALVGAQQGNWSVGFQSRLDQKWIKPFSDELVKGFPAQGVKRLLVASPAFVADCLETVVEIGDEYAELFKHHGGETLELVPSLNSDPAWVKAFAEMLTEALP